LFHWPGKKQKIEIILNLLPKSIFQWHDIFFNFEKNDIRPRVSIRIKMYYVRQKFALHMYRCTYTSKYLYNIIIIYRIPQSHLVLPYQTLFDLTLAPDGQNHTVDKKYMYKTKNFILVPRRYMYPLNRTQWKYYYIIIFYAYTFFNTRFIMP